MYFLSKNIQGTIAQGDALTLLKKLPEGSVHLIITSPPYFGCRAYADDDLGREEDPRQYVDRLLFFMWELHRVLHREGSFYLNMGDVYFGSKGFSRNKGRYARRTDKHYKAHKIVRPDGEYLQYKQLLMMPERVAMNMQMRGWILRNKIIWEKPNPIPSHAADRRYPVYEHFFHFVKSPKYYFDLERAKVLKHHRDVIRNGIEPFGKHLSSFPVSLIEPFIETTSREDNIVLDPFSGSGTTALAAMRLNRKYIGFEISKEFCEESRKRLRAERRRAKKAKSKRLANYAGQ